MSDDEGKTSETLSKMKHRHEMEIKVRFFDSYSASFDLIFIVQKLEQANKKSITSAQKSGKAGKAAAQDAAAVAMTTLQAEHAKQLSAWHAANDTATKDDDDDDKSNAVAAVESNVARAPSGLSKAAKRRLAKEKAEEEHNARVAEAAANRYELER
jgi:hypothetical protein